MVEKSNLLDHEYLFKQLRGLKPLKIIIWKRKHKND